MNILNDMEKAVNRIIKAIETKEKTIIYGDYDADGITSITVLKKYLEERGLQADYYIPNRLEEGYGLNKEAIQAPKKLWITPQNDAWSSVSSRAASQSLRAPSSSSSRSRSFSTSGVCRSTASG